MVVAIFCGGMVGLERQFRGKPAGIRTCSLICLGTAIFVYIGFIMSSNSSTADPGRVVAQVVAGVGFLGLGMVVKGGNGRILGITSAAVVWLLAAVGSLAGVGLFGAALALTLVTLLVLVGVERLENAFGGLRKGDRDGEESQEE